MRIDKKSENRFFQHSSNDNTNETNAAYYGCMCLVGWVPFCLLFDKTPVSKKFKFKWLEKLKEHHNFRFNILYSKFSMVTRIDEEEPNTWWQVTSVSGCWGVPWYLSDGPEALRDCRCHRVQKVYICSVTQTRTTIVRF